MAKKKQDDDFIAAKILLHNFCRENEIEQLGEYNGGNDSGWFEMDNEVQEYLESKGIYDIIYEHIENFLDYGSYAFEMDVQGTVLFNVDTGKFQVQGSESRTEYDERNDEYD